MTKEEILTKSREENKNTDYVLLDQQKHAVNAAVITASILCLIFLVTKVIVGLGMDYSYYAITSIIASVNGFFLYFKTKDKKYLPISVIWGLIAAGSTFVAISSMISSSVIL